MPVALKSLFSLPDIVRYRTPLFDPSFPYILMWSQKAGCTTVVKWFFAQLGLLEEARAHSRWVHDYEGQVFKKRQGYRKELAAALRSGEYTVVKVVRDPVVRAPSAFLVLAERGALVTHRRHWVQDHWALVDDWLAARGKDPGEGISFLDHLAMVKALQAESPRALNPHLAPQHVRGEEEVIDRIVPIERFADWTHAVAGEPGVKAIDPSTFADSRHHHRTAAERTEALGERPETVPIARGAYGDGRFPASRAFVNARTIPLIREAYCADFEAYGAHYAEAHAAAGAA
jgi:hypothetical protein